MDDNTYFVEADVTFRLKLMTDAPNKRQAIANIAKGRWDGQYMAEANDIMNPISVKNLKFVEDEDNDQ